MRAFQLGTPGVCLGNHAERTRPLSAAGEPRGERGYRGVDRFVPEGCSA